MSDVEQGSPEWHALRCGKVTASRMADVTARTKSGYGASRANYMAQIIAERLTGVVAENYTNAAMKWGTATEPEARAAYAFYRDAPVEEVAFVDHPSIPMAGASPDGLVGDDGLVEFKCPNTATHIESILDGDVIEGKYLKQMQWQMACTGRSWCDFVSFDPRMPESLKLHVIRVPREPGMIAELEAEAKAFLAEVDRKVEALHKVVSAATGSQPNTEFAT